MVNLNPRKDFTAHTAAVLGSTGSVGTQTLDILRELGIRAELLTAGTNTDLLARQINEFHPSAAAVSTEEAARELSALINDDTHTEILWREDEVLDAIRSTKADIIFHSVAGLAGIPSALAAAESGKRIAMANKEAIIALGDVIFDKIAVSGGELIPVDSEHNAIYRCLVGKETRDVSRIILTASGGPFFGRKTDELRSVTVADVLKHPTWKMGRKITVDCATLMNKGFEIIEAVRLFGTEEDRVDVTVHRQSIVHSMVRFIDGTMLAELGVPDMRDCIRYAATAPGFERRENGCLELGMMSKLTFDEPDTENFPLLIAAREAIRIGGTAPTALVSADEEAVAAFLDGRIGFTDISSVVIETLNRFDVSYEVNEESVGNADSEARRIAREYIRIR